MLEGSSLAQKCSVSGESVEVFYRQKLMIALNVSIVAFNHGCEEISTPILRQKYYEENYY